MGRVLCIANQKGGVGKTTTAINLASALTRAGNATLLVDLDPQCNATSGVGQAVADVHPLLSERTLREQTRATRTPGLDLLPGSRCFRDVDALVNDVAHCRSVPAQLERISLTYEFVLLDCPPSLGRLTHHALMAATEVLMPIQCEYFAMEGLTQMIEVIRDVMRRQPDRLEFGGILLTMYDAHLELTHEVDADVRDFFGEIVFDTVIPRDVALAEAPSHGQSVMDYAPRSRGTRAYIELCMEVLDRA